MHDLNLQTQFLIAQTLYHGTLRSLLEHLADDAAVISYAHRPYDFFRGLFQVSFSKILQLFNIEDVFQPYVALCANISETLTGFVPFHGGET
jgi:hypothetical protein